MNNIIQQNQENIKHNPGYIHHLLQTRYHAVKTYRNGNSVSFVCRNLKPPLCVGIKDLMALLTLSKINLIELYTNILIPILILKFVGLKISLEEILIFL